MAVRIRNFSNQEMQIGTPYRLNVRITGDPSYVRVDGIPDNFYYHWNASRNRVQIRGTPTDFVFDVEMVVVADDQVLRRMYSVLPLPPAFNTDIRETVVRGVPFTLPVVVNNPPKVVSLTGPYIGLDFDSTPEGFDLFGEIPEDAEFTKETFIFQVAVRNPKASLNGTITLDSIALGDVHFYILDGSTVREFSVVAPADGDVQHTITQSKSFNVPALPGVTANYVAIANDGTNLYLLHSPGGSSVADSLDDQIVVISPATQDGQTAGIIRRFPITRHSNFYAHELEDFFYRDGVLYILTSEVTSQYYQSYYVRYPIDNPNGVRMINLLERGGGISLIQGRVAAVLFSRNSPNQGNRFEVYPPGYIDGLTLIAESGDRYRTFDVIRSDFAINTNDVSMTAIGNYAYILSSTLPDKLSIVEVPTPVGEPIRRGEINLGTRLTNPQGITHL